MKRNKINCELPETDWVLGSWNSWQANNKNLTKAFNANVEIELLDMKTDNLVNCKKYPTYYKKTQRSNIKEEDLIVNYDCKSTLKAIEDRLGKRFAYVRFGDGELLMLKDFKGHQHTQWANKEIKKELKQALRVKHKDYLTGNVAGMNKESKTKEGLFAPFKNDKELQELTKEMTAKREFYYPVVFHYLYAFEKNKFNNFLNKLQKYSVGFVGGKHLRKVKDVIKINEFVETPSEQAYNTIDEWYPEVVKMAEKVDVILISLSMTANVVQKRLWRDKVKVGTIDFGSVANAITNYKGDYHSWIKKL